MTLYIKNHTLWPNGYYPVNVKLIKTIHHINILKKENHAIISINTEKALTNSNIPS